MQEDTAHCCGGWAYDFGWISKLDRVQYGDKPCQGLCKSIKKSLRLAWKCLSVRETDGSSFLATFTSSSQPELAGIVLASEINGSIL